jgi:hypothetical protein
MHHGGLCYLDFFDCGSARGHHYMEHWHEHFYSMPRREIVLHRAGGRKFAFDASCHIQQLLAQLEDTLLSWRHSFMIHRTLSHFAYTPF